MLLKTINEYIIYLYYLAIISLIVIFIMFLKKVNKLSKTVSKNTKGIDDINLKIETIKKETEYLKQSFSTSWKFFIGVAGIIAILRAIIRDYKSTVKQKRSLTKSVIKGCMLNPTVAKSFIIKK